MTSRIVIGLIGTALAGPALAQGDVTALLRGDVLGQTSTFFVGTGSLICGARLPALPKQAMTRAITRCSSAASGAPVAGERDPLLYFRGAIFRLHFA